MERINKKMFKKSPADLEAYMAFKHRGGRKPPKRAKALTEEIKKLQKAIDKNPPPKYAIIKVQKRDTKEVI